MGQDAGKKMRVLLAGGGSGGHVFPALAVAEELQGRGCVVIWSGRPRGMERNLVEGRGIEYRPMEALPWVGKGSAKRIVALLKLGFSAVAARRLIMETGTAVTVGTGGYVSVPAIVGSRLARRPSVLLEPNARAGFANRWLSRISSVACTGYEETGKELFCRSYWTGTPVRREFFRERTDHDAERVVLVVGGSQGALQINRLMPAVVGRLAESIGRFTVVHQAGAAHLKELEEQYRERETGEARLELVPFIEDMASAMLRADIVVSRAGALTLAEIAAAGRASILIPLAAAGAHQLDNARRFEAAGAAEVLATEGNEEEALGKVLSGLLQDRERRLRMAAAARALVRADAAERIADVVQILGRTA